MINRIIDEHPWLFIIIGTAILSVAASCTFAAIVMEWI